VYPAGEIDVCENFDIVLFGWLVVVRETPRDSEGRAPASL